MADRDQPRLPAGGARDRTTLMADPRSGQSQPAGAGALPTRPYEQVLADAVRVMTEAARLTWSRADGAGGSVAVRSDWAEFVALALAGAAASAGGIEQVLAGRPGSWEADHVRQLLISTVGHDEQQLPDHRTEPVVVDVFVDEIMADLGMWKDYDNAQQGLARRYADLASATRPGQAQEQWVLTAAQEPAPAPEVDAPECAR